MKRLTAICSILLLAGCGAPAEPEGVTSERGVDGEEVTIIATVVEWTDQYAVVQPTEEGVEPGTYPIPEELAGYDRVQFDWTNIGGTAVKEIEVGDTISLTYVRLEEESDPPELSVIYLQPWTPAEN